MPEQATDPNARFDGFWRHRHCLDEAQWLDFRQLVFETLRPCLPASRSLPDAGDTCIEDFFVDRIFDPAKKASPSEDKPVTLGYLVIMFRHYLSDRLRDPWLNRRTETGDALDDIPVEIAPLATLDDHGPDGRTNPPSGGRLLGGTPALGETRRGTVVDSAVSRLPLLRRQKRSPVRPGPPARHSRSPLQGGATRDHQRQGWIPQPERLPRHLPRPVA